MIDLSRLLPKLLRANGGNPELAVKLAWSRAAGAGLRRHATALKLDGRTLVVTVADAIWQKQLQHMSAELIFRTNNLLGQSLIDALLFRADPKGFSQTGEEAVGGSSDKTHNDPLPTELMFAASSIADEELRLRFLRAAQNCIARRDAKEDSQNKSYANH